MPSLFDALGSAAAGYTGEFNQTRAFNEQKRLDDAQLEHQKMLDEQANEDRLRQRGIDPATGQPFALPKELTQVIPNNKGVAPIDPSTGRPYAGGASPQQLIDFHNKRAEFFARQGDTTSAQIEANQAQALDAQLKAQQTQDQQWARMVYERTHPTPISSYDQWIIDHGGTPGHGQLSDYEKWEIEHGGSPSSGRVTSDQAAEAKSKWYSSWEKAIKPGQSQLGLPIPPLISPAKQAAAGKLFSAVDAAPNPIQKANELAQTVSDPAIKALLIDRGRVADMEKKSQRGGSGGSEDASNFIPPSPWP